MSDQLLRGVDEQESSEDNEEQDILLEITDNDIEKALAVDEKVNDEEEEIYFDAISTNRKRQSDIYEDVATDNKHLNDKDFENENVEKRKDGKQEEEQDGEERHLVPGIYDTPHYVNAPACLSSNTSGFASGEINQSELAREQENACLIPEKCHQSENVITESNLHENLPTSSDSKTLIYDVAENFGSDNNSRNIYDLATNITSDTLNNESNIYEFVKMSSTDGHPNGQPNGQPLNKDEQISVIPIYDLAQNLNPGNPVENSDEMNKKAGNVSVLYDLAQNVTETAPSGDAQDDDDTNNGQRNLIYDLPSTDTRKNAQKNQYDPAWTDSLFRNVPIEFLVRDISVIGPNKEQGVMETDLKTETNLKTETDLKTKTDRQTLDQESVEVEHRFMSESGNYDRLILGDKLARKSLPASSAYCRIGEEQTFQPSNIPDVKNSPESKTSSLDSRKHRRKTHTRKRKDAKTKTLNRTGTQTRKSDTDSLYTDVDGKDAKTKTLNRTGTQTRKSDTDSLYTDVDGEDAGTLQRDEEIYEPVGDDFDSDEYDNGDGWSSSEFEEYMEDQDEDDCFVQEKPLPPPPNKGGVQKTEKSNFIKRISSFRNKSEEEVEEEGPCLPVKINQTKHPPPELPQAPPHLSQTQVKKRLVIGCIIDSEKSYIESLERVIKEYKEPLLYNHGLKGTKVSIVMKKIEEIARHHQMFQIELAEKVQKWDLKEEIGGIFTASFSRPMVVDVYSVYVNNFSAAMEEIKALQSSRQTLRDFLKTAEARHADRLSIFGLMVKPVQRFPQFIMFMQDLLKYTPQNHHDRSNLQRALTDLENVTYRLNERKRETEQHLQAKQLMKSLNYRLIMDANPRLLRQDDLEQSESVNGQVKTKMRRIYLLDNTLIAVTVFQREQDGRTVERFKPKMTVPISDLELKESAITPEMRSIIKTDNSKYSIQSKLIDKTEEDLFHLNADLSHMLHDYTVLSQIEQLMASLKRSYQGISEDTVHETICDLQKMIQVKDQQLQLLNSCSIMLQDVGRNIKYIFQTTTPELREEWCKDFLLAKLALDSVNRPSWDISHNSSDEEEVVIHQPSMFMKWLSVDMPRYYTKMVCAVPVFLSSALPTEIGIQHLWVVMTAEKRTQVAIVSTQSSKPALVESFKATEYEVVAVETVPGYAIMETENAFIEDTVWMSTTNSEILVFSLFDEDGRRQSTTAREPRIKFSCIGVAMVMRYTDDRMFVGLANGIIVIYDRNYEDGVWNIDSPSIVQLGSAVVSSIIIIEEDVWVSCGASVYVIPMEESAFQETIDMHCGDNGEISDMVKSGVGLWVSYKEKSLLHLYHVETKQQLQEINVASAVDRVTTGNLGTNSEKMNKKCFVTSLMASRGFLWVGTNVGIILNFHLPRLRDGVPLIHGRANVCYHSHNGPVTFLIPIYCGTVNTWHQAKALDSSTSIREDNSGEHREKKKEKVEEKRHSIALSTEVKEKEFAGRSTPLDIPILNKKLKEKEDSQSLKSSSASLKSSESDELLGGSYEIVYGVKRFKSLENLDRIATSNFRDLRRSCVNTIDKNKTLTFRRELNQKLQARQNGTPETAEREISMFYGDLLHGDVESSGHAKPDWQGKIVQDLKKDSTQPGKVDSKKSVKVYRHTPVEIPVTSATSKSAVNITGSPDNKPEKIKMSVKKSLSFQFKNLRKSSQDLYRSASLKVNPGANPRFASMNTIQRRNCNAVVVVSGGDGYTDWRSPLKESPKHNDASLMFWMYKF